MGASFSRCFNMRRKMEIGKKIYKNQPYQIGDVVWASFQGFPCMWPGIIREIGRDTVMVVFFKSDDAEFNVKESRMKPFVPDEAEKKKNADKLKRQRATQKAFFQDYEWAVEIFTTNKLSAIPNEMSTTNEPPFISGFGTATKMSTSNEPACESGFGTATKMSTSNEPACESGFGTATKMSTSNEPACESGFGTATKMSTSNEPACESGLGTATEMSTSNEPACESGLGTATKMSTSNKPACESGLGTATEMSTSNEPACESGLGTATEMSTPNEPACASGLGTATKMSISNKPACESGFGTATEMSTSNEPACESGLGIATEMSTPNEPACESGLGTATEMSTSNEPAFESGLGTATEMSTPNEPACESGLGTATKMSTSNEPACESGLSTDTEMSTSNEQACESGLGTATEMSTPNEQVCESGLSTTAETSTPDEQVCGSGLGTATVMSSSNELVLNSGLLSANSVPIEKSSFNESVLVPGLSTASEKPTPSELLLFDSCFSTALSTAFKMPTSSEPLLDSCFPTATSTAFKMPTSNEPLLDSCFPTATSTAFKMPTSNEPLLDSCFPTATSTAFKMPTSNEPLLDSCFPTATEMSTSNEPLLDSGLCTTTFFKASFPIEPVLNSNFCTTVSTAPDMSTFNESVFDSGLCTATEMSKDYIAEEQHEDDDNDSDYIPEDQQVDPSNSDSNSDDMSIIYKLNALDNATHLAENKKPKKSVHVQMSNNNRRRKWDKKHYCLFFGEGSTNIRKHYLQKKHRSESQVQKILSYSVHSKERAMELEKLRNAGDYKHNYKVIKDGDGEVVTWRNATERIEVDDILPCEYCLAFFMKKELWRHHNNCKFKKNGPTRKYRKVSGKAALMLPCKTTTSDGFRAKILERMSSNQISLVARNDETIVKLGEKLYQKHGQLEHMYSYISQKLRELARLLLCLREEDADISNLSDVFEPKRFPLALKCTRQLCSYDELTNSYKNPSLALKIGYSLKKCATIVKSSSLIQEDDDRRIKAEGFLALCDSEWPEEISSAALTTLKTAKWNKPSPLPLTEDIAKLQNLLEEKLLDLGKKLKEKVEKSVWVKLCEVVLVKLVMFNRRRGGETERLTVESYRQKTRNNAPIKDIEHSLSTIGKKMCSLFHRIELRGKKGRLVPVLLTPDLVEKIDLLLKTRECVGVSAANPYVFARLHYGSTKPIRASDAIRKYAKISGVEIIENLTSTKLRKHIATVSQVMNLNEPELEQLATFMGHDLAIHRSFYRLPESTLQVAKLGKFLLALDSGQISKYSSGTLDDITLEDDDVDLEESEKENSIDDDDDDENDDMQVEHVNVGSPDPPNHSRTFRPSQKGNIKRLTPEQTRTLRTYFRENVELRQDLKRHECLQAINKNPCLSDLDWKKVKNTIHNWITSEKRKTFRLATI